MGRKYKKALVTTVQTYDELRSEVRKLGSQGVAIDKEHKGKIILVVGHSNTLPLLMADMGASKRVPPIAENEYDNIYIVSIPWFGKTKTIRLRYGEPYIP